MYDFRFTILEIKLKTQSSKIKTKLLCFKLIVLVFSIQFSVSSLNSYSQTGISVNTTGSLAENSAILDVSSTSQGLLIPRMTTVQRDLISSPSLSLLIFNTTTNCFEAYVNGIWYSVSCPPCNPPAPPASSFQLPTSIFQII